MKASQVVAKFEAEFRELLPRSFADVSEHIRAQHGLTPKLPKYRSPDQRHIAVAIAIALSDDFPILSARFDKANDEFLKYPFTGALGAPFDHVDSSSEAAEKLRLFLLDCEQMAEKPFNSLLQYLAPSRLEPMSWWISHTGPRLLLPIFEFALIVFVLARKPLLHPLIARPIHIGVLRQPVTITYFHFLVTTTAIGLILLALLTAQLRRLLGHILIIPILPLYLAGQLILFLLKKIQSLAYETLGQPTRFHIQARIARPSTCAAGIALTCFCLVNTVLFPGTAWADGNIAGVLQPYQ